MILDPHGREFFRVTITTIPQITDWEASFDEGTTWVAGADDSRTVPTANTWEWLVAGHLCDNTDILPTVPAAVITRSMKPKIRPVGVPPEKPVRHQLVPEIHYKSA